MYKFKYALGKGKPFSLWIESLFSEIKKVLIFIVSSDLIEHTAALMSSTWTYVGTKKYYLKSIKKWHDDQLKMCYKNNGKECVFLLLTV